MSRKVLVSPAVSCLSEEKFSLRCWVSGTSDHHLRRGQRVGPEPDGRHSELHRGRHHVRGAARGEAPPRDPVHSAPCSLASSRQPHHPPRAPLPRLPTLPVTAIRISPRMLPLTDGGGPSRAAPARAPPHRAQRALTRGLRRSEREREAAAKARHADLLARCAREPPPPPP